MLLYLHIPFCHRVCPYCSFYKHTPGGTPIPRFLEALLKEADHRLPPRETAPPTRTPSPSTAAPSPSTAAPSPSTAAPSASTPNVRPHPDIHISDMEYFAAGGSEPRRVRTMYLGGGTPSMLSPAHLRTLFTGLRRRLDPDALDEVTLEANPATFDLGKAGLFRDLGIRRVSLGIQSFAPHVLRTLGREHDPEQAAEAVKVLRKAGMPSVNIDLMFSVPGLSLDDWRSTLETALALEPDHISAYNLTYEEDTRFFESLRRGELDSDEDRDAEQFHLAHEMLTAAGYDHYETSNYARPGHHSTHNRGYWHGEDYLGLGPSAVSTLGAAPGQAIRTTNVADTDRYVRMVETIGHATVDHESLDAGQLRLERLALLLRTSDGIPADWVAGTDRLRLVDAGLAEVRDDAFVLTRRGSALVDPIAAELA